MSLLLQFSIALLVASSSKTVPANAQLRGGADTVQLRSTRGSSTAPKVSVQLYDEALCIGCFHFVTEQLVPAYDALGDVVMNVTVVPFGNAELDGDTLTCQHGEAECDANSYEQCAADIYPYPGRYLPFIDCLYKSFPMGHADEPFPSSVFAGCARSAALDWASVAACHDDKARAWQLQVDAARQTPKDHKYVPWVVINGEVMDMDKDDFDLLDYVCTAYELGGGSHPACGGSGNAHGTTTQAMERVSSK
jgi:interferon, gamma-inducible protein 30